MVIVVNNKESQIEARKITIQIDKEDWEFEISVNRFNELVVNKHQFGNGETALIIKPSVSNEIRLS